MNNIYLTSKLVHQTIICIWVLKETHYELNSQNSLYCVINSTHWNYVILHLVR